MHNLNFLLMSGRGCTAFSSYTNIALYTVGKIAMHFLNTKMIFTSMKTVIILVGNMQLVMYVSPIKYFGNIFHSVSNGGGGTFLVQADSI